MPSKIAVTGGIGSGKSTVCRILQEQGYPVFSCDEINRALWQEKDYLDGLRTRFPSCFTDGKPDKKALSALVFSDRKALERLNAYAHPRIYARLKEQMESVGRDCFAEVPLLFYGKGAGPQQRRTHALRCRTRRHHAAGGARAHRKTVRLRREAPPWLLFCPQ